MKEKYYGLGKERRGTKEMAIDGEERGGTQGVTMDWEKREEKQWIKI